MSSTRYAAPGSPLRQERYASHPALVTHGLKAACVADRCSVLGPEEQKARALIWWLQWRSHTEGLDAVVDEVLRLKPELRKNAPENLRPENYHRERLEEACLEPTSWLSGEAFSTAALLAKAWQRDRSATVVDTSVRRQIEKAVRLAAKTGSLVLLCGPNGNGKSHQARTLCEALPGELRYIQVPTGNDRKTFFQAFSAAHLAPEGDSWKAQELQRRVEHVLEFSGMVPVFDNAVDLLPDRERDANPDRVDWLVVSLAERRIPAVLITDNSFAVRAGAISARSRWSSARFEQRVLPLELKALTREEIEATAAAMLPKAAAADLRAIVHQTLTVGAGSLHMLRQIQACAEFVAEEAGRADVCSADIREAVKTFVIPASAARASARQIAEQQKPTRAGARRPFRAAFAEATRAARDTAATESISRPDLAPAPLRGMTPEGDALVIGG
jgi:energy-coupling factor transporter ATP-binding protein EcfA2